MKLFFIYEVENWDADFYSKVNDDVHVNIGMSLLFPGIENIACPCNLQFFQFARERIFQAMQEHMFT